ncbi:magnesium/cobalt transporter CorA, partial [bacterium]|nr:magnesium/cobalt transporter CorA [bacterium]
ECIPYVNKPSVSWIQIAGLRDVETLKAMGEQFTIHSLTLEDILNVEHRPKMEAAENFIYVVIKALAYDDRLEEIRMEQVSFLLGQRELLSFQERRNGVFDTIRNRLYRQTGRIRRLGADFLFYSLIDAIVDRYFPLLDRIGQKLEALEEEVSLNPTQDTLRKIHAYRRQLMMLRNVITPLREVTSGLLRSDTELINKKTINYLRDLHDHVIHVSETLQIHREILNGIMDLYFSSVSQRMNEIMKVLTIIATIFIPLSFLVGVYGMNFESMPELHWPWAYPVLWLFMLSVVSGMLFFFRKRGWF